MEAKKFRSKNHEIIDKFISPSPTTVDKGFWPREMKIASKLIKKYPFDLLLKIKDPFSTKISSLAWFLTEDGKKFLSLGFFEFQKEKTDLSCQIAEIPMSDTNIGEDIVIEQKPKTLKDFLKKYG